MSGRRGRGRGRGNGKAWSQEPFLVAHLSVGVFRGGGSWEGRSEE